MALSGNTDEANGYNSVAKNGVVSNVNFIKSMVTPIGSIVSWLKTFGAADSGTTDGSTTTDKLIQSGQNFETTVDIGMIVYNTTDATYANVTAIDSDTTLTLDTDIMATAEAYTIYKTPKLPDGWVECDGAALSDSDSPYDGETIPDLNGDNRFLRGDATSGGTGGSETHDHIAPVGIEGTTMYMSDNEYGTAQEAITYKNVESTTQSTGTITMQKTSSSSTLPTYYEVVWIMRVK